MLQAAARGLIEDTVKPMQNQLLAVVELKLLFKHNLTLDEFYERARELVEDAEFTGKASIECCMIQFLEDSVTLS